MVVLVCVVMEGWGTKEEVTPGRCLVRTANGGNEGVGRVGDVRGCVAR